MRLVWLILSILCISSCKQPVIRTASFAFYHWQSEFNLSNVEKNFLDSLGASKLYLRFFDVDWDVNTQQAIPLSQVDVKCSLPSTFEIVPTVFITNRTLKQLKEGQLEDLCKKISTKIESLLTNFPDHEIREIQLDCDWTQSTRENYFALLSCLAEVYRGQAIQLSATIRLHQVKFFQQTGVPPVHRGMLMFYNMGDLDDAKTNNSILDLTIAQQYFSNFSRYPLALDLALPIFHWGVLLRDGHLTKLINNLSVEDLRDSSRFIKLSDHHYGVKKSTYLQGYYLYQDDVIRLEKVLPGDLKQSVELLREQLRTTHLTMTFYHLDSTTIKYHPYEQLEALGSLWER